MNRNLIYLIVVISLGAIAYFFATDTSKNTIPKELRDFAVEDTSSIDKIFMADRSGKQVLLERKTGGWIVNQKYKARNDAIAYLLGTMKRIAVMSPVSKTARENIIKEMATVSTKVEIYQNNKLLKTYYVGSDVSQQLGTYMLIEESTNPFVMNIPGFNGFVSVRYFLKENDWRDKRIFNYTSKKLLSVKIDYPDTTEYSFQISHPDSAHLWVIALADNDTLKELDTLQTITYVNNSLWNIQFESFNHRLTDHQVDSIKSLTPYCTIHVKGKDNTEKLLKIYRKPAIKKEGNEVDNYGLLRKWDIDRMFAVIPGTDELVVIQAYVFDKIMKKVEDFRFKEESV
ncbi:MAG: hypothetical protein COC01_00305 [Bacteroidetes bacterium]|nr:DUF4340 domain-containing protein [Bacteroidia bacterium]PCH69911.1 MAG: hypothetical protein COC01_00305 [Bacteroidota bacterium]